MPTPPAEAIEPRPEPIIQATLATLVAFQDRGLAPLEGAIVAVHILARLAHDGLVDLDAMIELLRASVHAVDTVDQVFAAGVGRRGS